MATPPQSTALATPGLFPKLALLDLTAPPRFQHTVKRINDGADVNTFLTSLAYRDIGVWIMQLNRALCPRREAAVQPSVPSASAFAPPADSSSSTSSTSPSSSISRPTAIPASSLKLPSAARERARTFSLQDVQNEAVLPASVQRVRKLLQRSEALLAQAPAEPGPAGAAHRFGNPAFRKWVALLQDAARGMMQEELGIDGGDAAECASDTGTETETESEKRTGDQLENQVASDSQPVTALDELVSYFMGGWGSAERLDYGTGHELSFLAFLGGLWKLGFFADGEQDGPIERAIVFGIFEPYLVLVRKIILLYRLEPAGSHGVWGLDDHFFLPYIFGSAQLTRPITASEPMPLEGSVRSAPRPSSITDHTAVATHAPHNMYYAAIAFIHAVKRGPFAEHSPVLYDVSGISAGWGKINKGMLKMFNAEVLAKFPVVQHFRFGTLFAWAPDPHAAPSISSVHLRNQPHHLFQKPSVKPGAAGIAVTSTTISPPGGAGTMAPWAVGNSVGRGGANANAAVSARAQPSGTAAWAEATRMPGLPMPSGGMPYSRISSGTATPNTGSGTKIPSDGDGSGNGVGGSQPIQVSTRAPWSQ
ncbi:Serine/threonine-protein phosphatase 2A activator 1 [Ceratocystis fimbriata CBS 114723]|uniref:Serine/threonine-protein phosphatase 2A activator n=1 Tax=Ceratocystis fimbriata CBS 114723 TaxID=1035309 RepID=A0A2C5XGF0_9PEZI|nr:Serine/threonine-protein phosphatase 2A activator 1 [Ceratocystis fimbriata CBS 114723]